MLRRLSSAFGWKHQNGPAQDADDGEAHPDDDDIAGGLFGIEYCDSRGNSSLRDIVIKAVWWDRSGKLKVTAHCHLRDEARTFLVENMVTLVNGRTGQIIRNPAAFFAGFAGEESPELRAENSRTYRATYQVREYTREPQFAKPKPLSVPKMRKSLRDLIRPTAVLLMALAKSDDELTNPEIQVIADLVWEGARKTYTIWQTDMLSDMVIEIIALQPSKAMVNRALTTTMERGPFPPNLPEWLTYMARADGEISEGERETMRQMLVTMRKIAAGRKQA